MTTTWAQRAHSLPTELASVIKKDIGQLLLHLEQRQADAIEAARSVKNAPAQLTAGQRRAALQLLQEPTLVERILADYETCGLVGEQTNKLACYLACVSRRVPAHQANENALQHGDRLFSVYHTADGVKFWIITEADRSSTCVLMPEDY